jgi:hypothetical protein
MHCTVKVKNILCFLCMQVKPKVTCHQRQHIKHVLFCATLYIQDDSGEKINVLGVVSVGNYEKEILISVYLIVNVFRDRTV